MILGIGVDAIEPERIARALKNPRFAARMYTDAERARIAQAGRAAPERAAGIFAGKEAALKALGCGFSGVGFHDVEVLSDSAGRPQLCFHGTALDRLRALGAARWHISVSHIQAVTVAFVVLEDLPPATGGV